MMDSEQKSVNNPLSTPKHSEGDVEMKETIPNIEVKSEPERTPVDPSNEITESIVKNEKEVDKIVNKNNSEDNSQEAAMTESILSPPKSIETPNSEDIGSAEPAGEHSPPNTIIPENQTKPKHSDDVKESSAGGSNNETTTNESKRHSKSNKSKKKSDTTVRHVQANGTMPKSGKPWYAPVVAPVVAPALSTEKKKLNKPRGRPKVKARVAMYQSEISDNKGIKLCIKKSDQSAIIKTKPSRKRSRKSKHRLNESDDSDGSALDYKRKKRKEKSNNNTDKQKDITEYKEPIEQSCWGKSLPENVLYRIFQYSIYNEGCLPTLIRLGKVCHLWRSVSLSSSLWHNIDLSAWIRERHRTELKLKWLIENRLKGCKDLNIANWKISDIQCVLYKLAESCPDLVGITLTGWKGFTSDHLSFLVEKFTKLERLDLSSINVEMTKTKSAVGLQTLCNAIEILDGRLTHLHLAHNRLAGIPQIVTTLSAQCPNLILLDLSNVQTVAVSHGILHIEKLQSGCQKLKILRITNSHITLSPTSLPMQMESPGFPDLEELSVASLAVESRLINDEYLQRILKTSTKLNLLDVRGCARLTHDSLIRLPAWDLKHLFLSGCSITRDCGSGLELIASKWAHSLIEFDLAWANVQKPLDNAIRVLAEKGAESKSPLSHLNLCGSSVSEEAVKEILANCPFLNSINLSSCRGLPRGVKRLMQGPTELKELRDVLKVTLRAPQEQLPSE